MTGFKATSEYTGQRMSMLTCNALNSAESDVMASPRMRGSCGGSLLGVIQGSDDPMLGDLVLTVEALPELAQLVRIGIAVDAV